MDRFANERKKWCSTIVIVSILLISSILLQSFLLSHLYRLLLFGMKQRLPPLGITSLVCIAFVVYLSSISRNERAFWILIAVTVAVLFLIQWITLPAKLWRIQPYLALYSSLIIFGLPLLALALQRLWKWLVANTHGKIAGIAKVFAVVFLLILAYFYTQADLQHSTKINKTINSSDQAFYIKFIKDVRNSGFSSTGDHNRMPLYPYLQALFYRPEMSNKELFVQGKTINIALSLIFLALLFLVFIHYLRFSQAWLLVMIVAFSLFLYKAPYLQAEITFFTLAFLSFLLMLEMLLRPSWLLAILTGLITGLAYLTKGTVLPSFFLFGGLFIIQSLVSFFRGDAHADPTRPGKVVQQASYFFVCLVTFTLTIYPYISSMKETFGQYFYNVNTSIYIWYDNFDQALEQEAKYHFTEGRPSNLPQDQMPGLRKYLKDHTPQQILERFQSGVRMVFANIVTQLGVTNYLLNYAVILLFVILLDIRNSYAVIKKYPYLFLFIILYFLGYLFAFTWYSWIAGGRRFLFGLYIPFLLVVFISINKLAKNQQASNGSKGSIAPLKDYFSVVNILVGVTLIYNIWLGLTQVLFFGRFGS